MPESESIKEVAGLLAAGLVRLLARKSSELSPASGETSLDFPGQQSGHPAPDCPENSR